MQAAIDQVEMAPQAATFLIDRFGPLADHMRNR
jgi:truncated hemoglobin YjbI